MSDYGTLIEPGTIRFERLLPANQDTVWAYLVEPEMRAKWLAGGNVDLTPGGTVEFIFDNASLSEETEEVPDKYKHLPPVMHMKGRMFRCEPKRLLVHSWAEAEEGSNAEKDSEVTFELTPKGDRTLLVVTHRRLPEGEILKGVAAGWHNHLDILSAVIQDEKIKPFWATHMALEDAYHRRLNMG